MVRRAAALRAALDGGEYYDEVEHAGWRHQGGAKSAWSGRSADCDSHETEIDEDMHSDTMDMDTDAEVESPPRSESSLEERLAALDVQTIEYGKQLRAEFGESQRFEIKDMLDEVFAVLAYPRPQEAPEVAYLLDESERAATAEELNSAILGMND
jgi:hypothetical protein